MSDLTTLANVKAYLAVTTATDDTLLSNLITRVSQFVESWLNNPILTASYNQSFSGSGGQVFLLPDFPCTAVQSLTIDNVAIPGATDPTKTGYRFNSDMIVLNGYTFTGGLLNCNVQYTAGYATVPSDVEEAAIELVALTYKARDRIGLVSKGLAGETTTYLVKDMSDSIQTTLNQYRKITPT